jgi:DNA modification methylase
MEERIKHPYVKKEIIGNSTLYLGDCLEVMKIIPDKSIDMILCDLPYGTTACKWDTIIPFEPLWEKYKRIIKDKGCIALFGSEPFSSYLRLSNIKWFKYDWIWEKERGIGFQIAKYRPMQKHEIISIYGKGKINYYPIMTIGKYKMSKCGIYKSIDGGKVSPLAYISKDYIGKYNNEYYPLSILQFKRDKRLHPTQKPVLLLEYLIKTYTKEGETVLDNCMGSGSTKIACINTNRKFLGIEKDEKYFEIAVNRKPGDKKEPIKINKNIGLFE